MESRLSPARRSLQQLNPQAVLFRPPLAEPAVVAAGWARRSAYDCGVATQLLQSGGVAIQIACVLFSKTSASLVVVNASCSCQLRSSRKHPWLFTPSTPTLSSSVCLRTQATACLCTYSLSRNELKFNDNFGTLQPERKTWCRRPRLGPGCYLRHPECKRRGQPGEPMRSCGKPMFLIEYPLH